jgi:hypothetical protein
MWEASARLVGVPTSIRTKSEDHRLRRVARWTGFNPRLTWSRSDSSRWRHFTSLVKVCSNILRIVPIGILCSVLRYFPVDISVQWLGCWLDDRGSILVRDNQRTLSLRQRVQTGSGAHPASYLMAAGSSSLRVKRSGRETDHSPPSGAEVKNAWSYTSTHPYVFTAWCLIKHGESLWMWDSPSPGRGSNPTLSCRPPLPSSSTLILSYHRGQNGVMFRCSNIKCGFIPSHFPEQLRNIHKGLSHSGTPVLCAWPVPNDV